MAKKRERQQNREPFLKEDTDSIASTKTRTKASKHHQKQQKMISSGMSSKILKEALIQQKEIQAEEAKERNPNFNDLEEELPEREEEQYAEDEIDDFSGFSETQSQFNDYPEEIDENDEKLLEAFLSKDAGPQQTLADLIIEKIKKMDAHVSSETQPMPKLDLNLMLRMIAGKRYCGAGIVVDENEARRCQKAMREFLHLAGVFVLRDAVPFLGWLDWGGHEKAMKRNAEELDNIFDEWLEEHRRKRESGESANKEQDFMDTMLYALDGVNLAGYDADTVRKATSLSLIIGGTDTITVTIIWALSLLLNNTVALKNAQEEMDAHVGKDRLVNESDIEKLEYLQACVKEALRLYPAGPLSGFREFTADCTIGGYYVPAGTRLLLNIHKIHRDPRVWADPLEFKPERFLGSHKAVDVKGQHFELLPFGAGRRACPGTALGLQMSRLVLASILQAFEISPPSNEPIDMTATAGLASSLATPLQALLKPRLPASVYE